MHVRLEKDGVTVVLNDSPLKRAGEGAVYLIPDRPGLVAKVYHQPTPERADKLAALIANPPDDPTAAQGHASIAWPLDRLFDADGRCVGFVMPYIEKARSLFEVYHPKSRLRIWPMLHYGYLLRTARNLAVAVQALHKRQYVLGDLNESNVLVNSRMMLTVIDTDSLQVRAGDRLFRCEVAKPDYTAPEIQGADFKTIERKPEQDNFALAVLIFQLLMQGVHPFAGQFTGEGDPAPLLRCIVEGYWPYADLLKGPYSPSRTAPPFAMLAPPVRALLRRCFEDGHVRPSDRPDAVEWTKALGGAEKELVECPANSQHLSRKGYEACPWCELTVKQGRDPFPPKEEGPGAAKAAPTAVAAVQARPTPAAPLATPQKPQPKEPVGAPRAAAGRKAAAAWLPPVLRTPWPWVIAGGAAALLVLVGVVVANALRPVAPPVAVVHLEPPSPNRIVNPEPPQLPPGPNPVAISGPQPGKPFTNSIGMKFQWIEPGSFLMGSPDGTTPPGVPAETDRSNDETPHQVTLTKGFYMGVYLVTQEQWERVLGKAANLSQFRGTTDDEKKLPVDTVSWGECQGFCRKLSALEGRQYTLPTEAQWEYACRAGTTTAYSFGDDPKALDDYAWYSGNSEFHPHPVGTKKPNPWGLYDMHGNLFQWCADYYDPKYYTKSPNKDPENLSPSVARVQRGDSWGGIPRESRSASRNGDAPASHTGSRGCRVALCLDIPPVAVVNPEPPQLPPGPAPVATAGPQPGKPFTNSIGMQFQWIEPGSYLMGSPDGKTPPGVPAETDRSIDETPHQVTLTKGFHMGVYLVTQEQWNRVFFMGKTDDVKKELPVVSVSWDDCQEFCRKLSALESRTYELPTEAEWEYACRAGTTTAFSFGDDPKALSNYAWYGGNSGGHPHPVGTKKPNPWGLYDMHGNLFQWCADGYGPYPEGSTKDPKGKDSPNTRTLRGGSWFIVPEFCRSANRGQKDPSRRDGNYGFRVVLRAASRTP